MAALVQNAGTYKHVAAAGSGMLVTPGGVIERYVCTTNGTIAISEGVASGGATILATLSVVAGTTYNFGFRCPRGAYVTVSSAVGTFVL
jgi:hypothetical protein